MSEAPFEVYQEMVQHLRKFGNQWVLVIDDELLKIWNVDPNEPIDVTTDGNALLVTAPSRKAQFDAALKTTNELFGPALKRLAE